MTPAIATLVGGLCAAISALVASGLTKRTADRARIAQAEIDERKVNREDFDSITANLWKSIGQLEAQLTDERAARVTAENRAIAAESRAQAAETSVHRLEDRVSQLEAVLEQHNMPIPPPT